MNIDIDLDTIKNNFIIILILVFIVFIILTLISIYNINLNPTYPPPKLLQEVLVESFVNVNENINNNNKKIDPEEKLALLKEVKDMKLFPIDSFCEAHLGKAGELEKACEILSKEKCLETNCCIYTSFEKCSAGSALGPTYTKPGLDHYYYQNKMFKRK